MSYVSPPLNHLAHVITFLLPLKTFLLPLKLVNMRACVDSLYQALFKRKGLDTRLVDDMSIKLETLNTMTARNYQSWRCGDH